MKCADLGPRISEAAVVVYDIVSNSQPLHPAGLRGQHTPRLLFGFTISNEQSAQLSLLLAIDDENAVDKALQRRFDQKWNCDYLVVTAGCSRTTAQFFGFDRLTYCFFLNTRMDNAFQTPAGVIIRENQLPHCGPIKITVGIDNRFAKRLYNLVERGLARYHNVARDNIGID